MDLSPLLLLTFCTSLRGCQPISFQLPFLDHGIGQNLSAVVLVADGTEEMEAVTTIDVLRRGGMRVTVAGVDGAGPVTCQQGVVLTPDAALLSLRDDLFDLVVVPGGEKGCNAMAQSADVGQFLAAHADGGKFIAATTAGPIVLDAHKINYLKRLTSAPEYASKLKNHYSYYDWEETIVDIAGKMVTGRFPGTLLEFSLALVNHLAGRKTAERISYDLQPYSTLVA